MRLNEFLDTRIFIRSKKADLSLSINAIVVLILAITMLGLGLGFMKNMFKKTTSQFSEVGASIKTQMIEELKESNERLAFNQQDIEMKRNEQKELYFGIKNNYGTGTYPNMFYIDKRCDKALGKTINSEADAPALETFTEWEVNNGEVGVLKLVINTPSTLNPTTYSCKLSLSVDQCNGVPQGDCETVDEDGADGIDCSWTQLEGATVSSCNLIPDESNTVYPLPYAEKQFYITVT